ncbi:MAG: hypothetical protein AAF494_01705 [Pseudomonadota bacterium]
MSLDYIITSPLTVYIAPVGEAFPAIDAEPAGNWQRLGTDGDRAYTEEGLAISHSKTYNKIRGAGASAPLKAALQEEDLMIQLTMMDLTLEGYSYALNGNTVRTTAAASGSAGYKEVGLSQSVRNVNEFALLARGPSTYDQAMNMQYQVPRCFDTGSARPVFRKGEPAGLTLELTALEDLTQSDPELRFGRIVAQHQAPLP